MTLCSTSNMVSEFVHGSRLGSEVRLGRVTKLGPRARDDGDMAVG